jgi:hypothetical protein
LSGRIRQLQSLLASGGTVQKKWHRSIILKRAKHGHCVTSQTNAYGSLTTLTKYGAAIQWSDFDVPQYSDASVRDFASSYHRRRKIKKWLMLLAVAAGAAFGYFNGQ